LLDALADVSSAKQDLGTAGADDADARAFREAGLDVDASPPGEIGAALKARPESVTVMVAGALDDWELVRRQDKQPTARQTSPLELARAADPDQFRDKIRTAIVQPDAKACEAALRTLAADPKAAELPPPSAVLIAEYRDAAAGRFAWPEQAQGRSRVHGLRRYGPRPKALRRSSTASRSCAGSQPEAGRRPAGRPSL